MNAGRRPSRHGITIVNATRSLSTYVDPSTVNVRTSIVSFGQALRATDVYASIALPPLEYAYSGETTAGVEPASIEASGFKQYTPARGVDIETMFFVQAGINIGPVCIDTCSGTTRP
jgi:hypothetical protein